jgi:hypothetical protein
MTERLLMVALCFWLGWPESAKPPLTPSQLQVKAKEKSISEMCDRKPKSKEAKDLCRRWKKQQGFL